MRGHEPLIALRRRGVAPSSVSIAVGDDGAACWRDWLHFGSMAHVLVEPGDSVPRLDLRFVVGLLVFIDGYDRARCEALHQACRDAGAKRVVTHVFRNGARNEPVSFLQIVDAAVTYEAETEAA